MTHAIISSQPFVVEFREGNNTKRVTFQLPLLPLEIKAMYSSIEFDEPELSNMRVIVAGANERLLLDGGLIMAHLPARIIPP